MLLRSPSSPLLSSWIKDSSSPESLIIPKTISSSSLTPSPNLNPILKASSEQNLRDLPKVKTKLFSGELCLGAMCVESMVEGAEEESAVLVDGGGFSSNGGRLCGGSGGGGSGDSGGEEECWGSDHGYDSMDRYYQKMIKANPANSLLLHNYAKFLKEVKGDYEKAEEYCGRAILANANDGEILSLYGELMWDVHKDAERSDSYFDRALQAAPDDCYIMASYARCLWDAEDDDEEDDEDEEDQQILRETSKIAPSMALQSFQ